MNWYKEARNPGRRNKLENYAANLCRSVFPVLKKIQAGRGITLQDGKDYSFPQIYEIDVNSRADKSPTDKPEIGGYSSGYVEDSSAYMMIEVNLPKGSEMIDQNHYSYVYGQLQDAVMHELTHIFKKSNQFFARRKQLTSDVFLNKILDYYLDPFEVEAFARGFYYKAKKSRQQFGDVLDQYLGRLKTVLEEHQDSDESEKRDVLDSIRNAITQKAVDMFPAINS